MQSRKKYVIWWWELKGILLLILILLLLQLQVEAGGKARGVKWWASFGGSEKKLNWGFTFLSPNTLCEWLLSLTLGIHYLSSSQLFIIHPLLTFFLKQNHIFHCAAHFPSPFRFMAHWSQSNLKLL